MPSVSSPRRRNRRPEGAFTLLEVLMALLIGMIGLIGTVAIQSTIFHASQTVNEGAIATRLAVQKLEEMNIALTTGPPPTGVDDMRALWVQTGQAGVWKTDYLSSGGAVSAARTPVFRFLREWRVDCPNACAIGMPYEIQVRVTYTNDSGASKVVELDGQRRKSW